MTTNLEKLAVIDRTRLSSFLTNINAKSSLQEIRGTVARLRSLSVSANADPSMELDVKTLQAQIDKLSDDLEYAGALLDLYENENDVQYTKFESNVLSTISSYTTAIVAIATYNRQWFASLRLNRRLKSRLASAILKEVNKFGVTDVGTLQLVATEDAEMQIAMRLEAIQQAQTLRG